MPGKLTKNEAEATGAPAPPVLVGAGSDADADVDVSAFYLEPEDDNGNHEYKYKLLGLSHDELEGKVTQMDFRLDEGGGEAIYEIGVADDGCPLGLNDADLDASMKTLYHMAEQADATLQVVTKNESPITLNNEDYRKMYARCHGIFPTSITKNIIETPRYTCEVLVRRNNRKSNYVGLRIAVGGSVDAGKSTTVGVLTHGVLDNANGLARKEVFNFKHEIDSGRTTSVAQEILGFDSDGMIVNEKLGKMKSPTWPEIVAASSKICTFFDMAGHEKYLKTTIRGISGSYPDYTFIMIAAGSSTAITKMTKEHMIITLMQKIPMIIIFTKIDDAYEHIETRNMELLKKMLTGSGVNKTPYLIKNPSDVLNACHNIRSGAIVPILRISNVTGQNLDLLKSMINLLPPRTNYHEQLKKPVKYTIQETFQVGGVGTVVSGFQMSGTVNVLDKLWLGPDSNGKFIPVVIKSIQDKRTNISTSFAGQNICFALRGIVRSQVRRGMMLLDSSLPEPKGILEFNAEIEIFGGNSVSIRVGYEPVIHISNIKQTAKIVAIRDVIRKLTKPLPENPKAKKAAATSASAEAEGDKEKDIPEHDSHGNPVLRAGDRAIVTFKMCFTPVHFEVGSKILFREGRTRGVGIVESLISLEITKMNEEARIAARGTAAIKTGKIGASERRRIKKDRLIKAGSLANTGGNAGTSTTNAAGTSNAASR